MSPNHWGPPTWIFLHTFAEKIKEESFPMIGSHIVYLMMQVCFNLPCPECSQHARTFWSRVTPSNIKTKIDLINLLYVFHNIVNKRKHQLLFKYIDLQYYKTRNIVETFNQFAKNFNTKGNMKLLNESFHRKLMLTSLKNWIMSNLQHFNL